MLLAFGNDVGNRGASFATGWLRAIGHASYEVYMFHMLVVLALIDLFKRSHAPNSLIAPAYVAMLLLSLALGHAVFRLYSEPLNRALRGYARTAGAIATAPQTPRTLPHRPQ
jgi:peptidoglycan/LPS O-acetylase OafA/YrhL